MRRGRGSPATGHAVAPIVGDSPIELATGSAADALASFSAAFGRPPDGDEAVAWAAMSPAQREAATRRVGVVRRWTDDRSGLTAGIAAAEAGVKLSRFYDLASTWGGGARRLFDVGRHAGSQSGRRGKFDADLLNELQGAAPRVVLARRDAPVARLVEQLVASVDAGGRRMPAHNTLREMVERERRRLETGELAGTRPAFDMVGTGLLRADGRHHLLFGVVDRTTRLVLGHALGEWEAGVAAHAAAADDALLRIGGGGFAGLAWSGATERIDVVPAGDADVWAAVDRAACPVECGTADGGRSRGGYFRRFVGPAIGRLRLSSVRAALERRDIDAADVVLDDGAAALRVGVEVAAHNAAVRAAASTAGEPLAGPTTMAALEWMRGLADR